MATSHIREVLKHLRHSVLDSDEPGCTDGHLLDRFLGHRDDAALAVLVKRHGPMVWGVCRRVLANHHDAEDAFQATFLVLVRKAASVVPRAMVANWLYGVAHQTALKARATVAKRRAREKHVMALPEPPVAEPDLWHELQPLLDQELTRLPDKYRAVIVLCDFEGKTRKEAARQLGVPEGTIASRMATARRMLAKRLARRGIAASGGVLAAVLTEKVATARVPPSVVSSTIKAVTLVAAGKAAATGVISAKVAALTEGVLKSMFLTKIKIATAISMLMAALIVGGRFYRMEAAEEPPVAQGKRTSTGPGLGGGTAPEKNKATKPPQIVTLADYVQSCTWTLKQVNVDASTISLSDKVPGALSYQVVGRLLPNESRVLEGLPVAPDVKVFVNGHAGKLADLATLAGQNTKLTVMLKMRDRNAAVIEINAISQPAPAHYTVEKLDLKKNMIIVNVGARQIMELPLAQDAKLIVGVPGPVDPQVVESKMSEIAPGTRVRLLIGMEGGHPVVRSVMYSK